MRTNRLEAFSDGVIAIIITIMVLELKVPHDTSLHALLLMWPIFLSYFLSFAVVAIMWVNHHQLISLALRASAGVLWTNNLLLLCMSLIPFVTAYMGENHGASLPVACYGVVCVGCALGFWALRTAITHQVSEHGGHHVHQTKAQRKDLFSLILYAASIPLAFVSPMASYIIFFFVAASYFLPAGILENRPSRGS